MHYEIFIWKFVVIFNKYVLSDISDFLSTLVKQFSGYIFTGLIAYFNSPKHF